MAPAANGYAARQTLISCRFRGPFRLYLSTSESASDPSSQPPPPFGSRRPLVFPPSYRLRVQGHLHSDRLPAPSPGKRLETIFTLVGSGYQAVVSVCGLDNFRQRSLSFLSLSLSFPFVSPRIGAAI